MGPPEAPRAQTLQNLLHMPYMHTWYQTCFEGFRARFKDLQNLRDCFDLRGVQASQAENGVCRLRLEQTKNSKASLVPCVLQLPSMPS